jgi:steroid delta-isomerase-like uncharacterized protein
MEERFAASCNIELLKTASLRFKTRDLDGYLEMYSDSVIHHGFSSRIRPGIAGLRDHYQALWKGFPDIRIDIHDIIADGEKVVHRFTFHGTHRGEYVGVTPTGKAVAAAGIHINLFAGGKCVEVWSAFDTFRFLSEIGAVPPLRTLKKSATSGGR